MKIRLVIVVVFAFCLTASAQQKTSMSELSWLSSCWEGRQGESVIEEHWSKPEGGTCSGLVEL